LNAFTTLALAGAAFELHRASNLHTAAAPAFGDLVAASDVMTGETVMAKGHGS
jgi:hypothetical protein